MVWGCGRLVGDHRSRVKQVRRHGADPFAYIEWVFEKLMHNPPSRQFGDRKRVRVSDQALGNFGFDGRHALQAALVHRFVFSLGQRPLAFQT
jgi:hypothetical protein